MFGSVLMGKLELLTGIKLVQETVVIQCNQEVWIIPSEPPAEPKGCNQKGHMTALASLHWLSLKNTLKCFF